MMNDDFLSHHLVSRYEQCSFSSCLQLSNDGLQIDQNSSLESYNSQFLQQDTFNLSSLMIFVVDGEDIGAVIV